MSIVVRSLVMAHIVPFSVIIFLIRIMPSCTISLDDIDFDAINNVAYREDFQFKHSLFPQDEQFYDTFNVPHRDSSRRKRSSVTIAYPSRSALVTDYEFKIPLLAPAHVYLPLTFQARSAMVMPQTEIGLFNLARSFQDRIDLFKAAEQLFQSVGLDGRSCVLRALCEKSELDILTDGLLSEAISLLLEFSSPTGNIIFRDYEIARETGRTNGDCHLKYHKCPVSIFSLIDSKFYESQS